MKFIFVDSFNLVWNGYSARNQDGISGSHSAIMYLAEGIAKNANHYVEIVSTKNKLIEGTHLNVKYTNFNNFQNQECDFIITNNVLDTLCILDKIYNYNKIIISTQNDLCYYDRLFTIDKNKILIGYVSEFAKTNILNVQPFLNDYNNIILYNSFDLNDLINVPFIENKNNQLCYFACIQRGYKMLLEIVKQLNGYQLISNTYVNKDRSLFSIQDENKITLTNNSAKYTILKSVSESKYFVYPLINLDNNMIHYDTFGYVVLEALLLGCIVIAPKIKVYEELYGDAICYIETDDIIPTEDLHYWKKKNPNFGFPILNRYVEKIKLLDENDELRKSYIEKGLLLKEKFSNKKISNELVCYLQNDVKSHLENHLISLSHLHFIPLNHVKYLQNLKAQGYEPKVIYDIGSCVLHWTKEAKKLWPNATYILFDAFSQVEFLYKEYGYDYYISVLSDEDDKIIKFYQNDYSPGGNSYYREIGCENGKYFPEDKYIEKVTKTINTIVKERGFPLPDFVKIDVQGAEVDIIKGGIDTFKNASRMIVELQHTEYNAGALKSDESLPLIENLLGFKCSDPLFQNNGPDGDYGFINPVKLEKNILTVFAGRESNLKVLCKYLQKALDLKIIDEVHLWNNTRNDSDEKYIKTISNLKRTSSTREGNYILITPEIKENSFELNVRASNDIHIKITNYNDETEYEIVLGGWSNTRSVIRKNNNQIFILLQNNVADGIFRNKFTVTVVDNILSVMKNSDVLFSQEITDNFEIKEVYFKTGHGCVGDLEYNTIANRGFYLMDTCEKSWKNYYNHYSNIEYEYSTILKCDDDIVFIDLLKLPKFIQFIKNNDNYNLIFANTINNGVSAYFQQNKYNLIPKEIMDLEYPKRGWCGSLWENGEKAEKLHNYFIENYDKFLNYDYNNEVIPIDTRFSINFFGYKAKNWHKIKDCYLDDERNLTVDYVYNRNFKNILYCDFYVAHLSFYKQNKTGINLNSLINKYDKLYYDVVADAM